MGRRIKKPYIPFPPEYEDALLLGLEVETKKAAIAHKCSWADADDFRQGAYIYITTHWAYDPTKSKLCTYIGNCVKWYIGKQFIKKGKEKLVYYGEGEEDSWAIFATPPEYKYTMDDVVEHAGLTEQEKRIVYARLEGVKAMEVGRQEKLNQGNLVAILKKIKLKLKSFDPESLDGEQEP
ncbi:MAG: hypothetical protein IKP00_07105 [Victivallales bacterium]|nr:hypothetical protein [Victivallales bacterium]